jgi:hypothetical protein
VKTIWADFNARIEDDLVSLETRGSKTDLVVKDVQPDERVWLTDTDLWVQGTVQWDGLRYSARIDWSTQRDSAPEEEEP